ncbi:hypothetical protein IQ226_18255 [Dolichospermum sp. LEGE 00240]|nr:MULTISPECIES: hypothetical protein [Aphanizomenonaceae]MDM3845933.1 hypothetical protein [Aphanizomenon gracile PMC638.10]MDM3852855.1 hypothetical protein [Aphanizomenon gracile PMC627.10]MDM3857394.1 hypothetical protein [Aphanizomenon gracile PMC649.10]MDM3862775.1 hypothetical protein [Aphanizomenon gracile PMC644.10]MBE9251034.1 hypothetical protein [Dolichospermum sp. LEGE 00240]
MAYSNKTLSSCHERAKVLLRYNYWEFSHLAVKKNEIVPVAVYSSEGEQMTTYIFFDQALKMLTIAFLAAPIMLIAASSIGLAVIETIEKTGDS